MSAVSAKISLVVLRRLMKISINLLQGEFNLSVSNQTECVLLETSK